MLWSASRCLRIPMASWGQLSDVGLMLRVNESVAGQNLSMQELSDHTHHTPGTGLTAGCGGLMRSEKTTHTHTHNTSSQNTHWGSVVSHKGNFTRTELQKEPPPYKKNTLLHVFTCHHVFLRLQHRYEPTPPVTFWWQLSNVDVWPLIWPKATLLSRVSTLLFLFAASV